MALDTGSVPCDLLNNSTANIPAGFTASTTSFEDVWIPSSATVTEGLRIIFQSGTTIKTFSEILNTTRLPPTVANAAPTNTGTMIKTQIIQVNID